jgi:transposase
LNNGLEGLNETSRSGRPSRLTLQQKKIPCDYIETYSKRYQSGCLQGENIQTYIAPHFTIEYEISNFYRLLRELVLSWITSHFKHPKQSQKTQDILRNMTI